jgi:hypothetical protein
MQVASHVFMGITKATSVLPTIYSPLGKACAGMDLSAVHDILLKTGYKDDEGAENEVTNNQIYAASTCGDGLSSLFLPLRPLHHCMVRRKKKRCGSSFAFRM